jgi:hypothetical protein
LLGCLTCLSSKGTVLELFVERSSASSISRYSDLEGMMNDA